MSGDPQDDTPTQGDMTPMEVTCSSGEHECSGSCVPNDSTAACGPSCEKCPDGSDGARSVCKGNACGFECASGRLCGDRCGECCANSDCVKRSGFDATCDKSSLTCKYECSGACCSDSDCPKQSGKVGMCDLSSHQCEYSCADGTKPCNGKCIPGSGCCDDSECTGNFACSNNVCSSSTCRNGYDYCDGSCITTSQCCEDSECGDHTCGSNHQCTNTCRDGFVTCSGGSCKKKVGVCTAVIWTANSGACNPNICTAENAICDTNKLARTLAKSNDEASLKSECASYHADLLRRVCAKYTNPDPTMPVEVTFYWDVTGDDGAKLTNGILTTDTCK